MKKLTFVILALLMGVSIFSLEIRARSNEINVEESKENVEESPASELNNSIANTLNKETEVDATQESISELEAEFVSKKELTLSEDLGNNSFQFQNNYQFLYTSNTCVTMYLYNKDSLDPHSYINCVGYLTEFLGENPVNSNYYNIRFQGGVYAINKQDVMKFIDKDNVKSMPYYINDNGYVTRYIENNPEIENSYIYISKLGKAPSWMENNKKYFSFDGIYFKDGIEKFGNYESQINSVNYDNPYYDYYLYLPVRTKTEYNGSQLSAAFNYFYSQSSYSERETKMLETGQNFYDVQSKFGINALIILSMGIHESAYGTSTFAVERNNLFGVGAVDSDPGSAAWFSTIESGISEQGNFLSWVYADADYQYGSLYYGANLGNKSLGMNVKYASDPFWGEKIARSMALIDRYLGEKDYQKYDLGIVSQQARVYWNEAMTDFAHTYKTSTGSENFMYPVVINSIGDSFSIAMEPPYNENRVVGSRFPAGGAYNWNNKGFVSKNNIKIISKNVPEEEKVTIGDTIYYLDVNKNIKYSEKYKDNKKIAVYTYFSDTKIETQSTKIRYKHILEETGTGIVQYTEEYNTQQKKISVYTYFANTKIGTQSTKIRYKHALEETGTGIVKYTEEYNTQQKKISVYTYFSNTKIGTQSTKIRYKHALEETGTGIVKYTEEYNTQQKKISVYTYFADTKIGTQSTKIRYKHALEETGTGIVKYTEEYNTQQKKISVYTYFANTKIGTQSTKIKYKHVLIKNSNTIIDYSEQFNEAQQKHAVITYQANSALGTQSKKISVIYHLEGKRLLYSETKNPQTQQTTTIYEYFPSATLANRVIELKYEVDEQRRIIKATQMSEQSQEPIAYIYYKAETKYGEDHKNKIENIIWI